MLRTNLPASANIFILEYLSVVRFNVLKLNDWLEQLLSLSDSNEDYEFIRDNNEDASYNELVYASGYHVNLARNLVLVGLVGIVIVLICFQVTMCDRCCFRRQRQRFDAWWSNFFVRFLYEVFFEICISLTLTVALVGSETQSLSNYGVIVCTVIVAILCAFGLSLLVYLCFKSGPYVPDSYEKGSLMNSVWGYRRLSPSLCYLVEE